MADSGSLTQIDDLCCRFSSGWIEAYQNITVMKIVMKPANTVQSHQSLGDVNADPCPIQAGQKVSVQHAGVDAPRGARSSITYELHGEGALVYDAKDLGEPVLALH